MVTRQEQTTSTMQLVADLIKEVRTLLRQEVALARAEFREEIAQIFTAMALFAVAAGTLAVAGLWILIAVTRALAYLFTWPLAGVYAGVGAALAVVALVLLAVVWHRVKTIRMLPQTRETLAEHMNWAARQAGERA